MKFIKKTNNKMKIAFCKFAGLANGGVEKYLQTIAIILKKQGHEIDYYYTNAAPITTTSWVHPDNDESRIKLMSDNDIKLIKINVGHRVNNEWVDTDFFDKFENCDVLGEFYLFPKEIGQNSEEDIFFSGY